MCGHNRMITDSRSRPDAFTPREPQTWEETGIESSVVEPIILRHLIGVGADSGRGMAGLLGLSMALTRELMDQIRNLRLIQHRGPAPAGDFFYELTDAGRTKAAEMRRISTYVGPAPVPFAQYEVSVRAQIVRSSPPGRTDLERAFAGLIIPERLMNRLGPAISSSHAIFLYGAPGNGKTSIAERITRSYGDSIWIPQCILIGGQLVKLYDPAVHEKIDTMERADRRWLRIRRPTVLAGGELTMEMLEIQTSPVHNIHEAPLQLKANGGTLVIDDFGRQQIRPEDLLNRWIFPLERRIDFLRLPDGRKIAVPFGALLIFSTNLDPKALADEAFLRRIPYKVPVDDPSPEQFRVLLERLAQEYNVTLPAGSAAHLMNRHFVQVKRPFRFCYPRDLILQIYYQCKWDNRPAMATPEDWDRAVAIYFGEL